MVMLTRVIRFIRRGNGIVLTDVEYADSTSNTTAPETGWQTDAPQWVNGHFIWTRTHIVYSDGMDVYSKPVCLPSGKGIAKITEEYYKSSSPTQLEGDEWNTTVPQWEDRYYIWTRSFIEYTDGTTYTTPAVCSTGASGPAGRGIASTTRQWAISKNGTDKGYEEVYLWNKSWFTYSPAVSTDYPYLWRRSKNVYTDTTEDKEWRYECIGKLGDKGIDGNGSEWIYYRNNSKTFDGGVTKNPSKWEISQEDDYIVENSGWTDEPMGVSEDWLYEWISVRKKTNGKWGGYSEPKIWHRFAKDGEKGATLRGPQLWRDCPDGYSFQAGGKGEEYKDVVLYGEEGSEIPYSCIKSHAKTATNYPGSVADANNGYWQQGDIVELVATKILLSKYALIENLGASAIEMRDEDGNVVFEAVDGEVTCNSGTFTNVDVTGKITATSGKIGNVSISSTGAITTPYFQVSADGKLYCISADVSGKIAASSGNIGGITINTDGIAAYTEGENGNQYGFSLKKDGSLVCNKAQITGKLYAEEGEFSGNCKIGGLFYRKSVVINNDNANDYGKFNEVNNIFALDLTKTGFNVQLELSGKIVIVILPNDESFIGAEVQIVNLCTKLDGTHIVIWVDAMVNGTTAGGRSHTVYFSSVATYKCIKYKSSVVWIPISQVRNDDNSSVNPLA